MSQPSLLLFSLKTNEICSLQTILCHGGLFSRLITHPSPPTRPDPKPSWSIYHQKLHKDR
ncbi:hypothetical protein ES332_A03G182200v1 [Gossypium tomentosum]|uniref:Uncharacterized protein n=1 Tax=Gossypium tomentosum TaxID=34277 RepID=A0A5D2R8V8_GOSTO|nr:hypothetical protein ES332_A03G182200v1 [Gossypium tomentosum]